MPDVIGAFILAFAAALGGGVIRDAILSVPRRVLRPALFSIVLGALVAMRLPSVIQRLGRLRVADAFGLGLFNAAGMVKALQSGAVDPVFAVVLGAITGSGGGIIRDVLCGEMPALLRPGELYVTTCLVGGVAGLAAIWSGAPLGTATVVTATVTIVFRLLAIRFDWRLSPLHWEE
jgi:uncharacterized membrane protein YeiH